MPAQFDASPERRYVAALHSLALVCDDRALTERLKRRPASREAGSDEFVARMVRFNRWLKDNADRTEPPMAPLDTTELSVAEAAERTAAWVRSRIGPPAWR